MPPSTLSKCAPLAVLLAGLAVTPALADDVLVTLASGDTIRATVVSDANGTLVLKHPVLGELKIDRASVVKIEPAPAAKAAAPAATATPAVVTPAPAPAAAPPTEAPAAPPAAPPAQQPATKDAAPPTEPAKDAAPAEPAKPKWSGAIEGNITGVAAENDQWDLRVSARALRETPDDKLNMYAEYFLKTLGGADSNNTGSAITDSNLLANVTYDRFLNPGPWLYFGKGQYEYDINQSWENRVSGWGGVGYKFLEQPKKYDLIGKVGFGVAREFGGVDEWFPQMYLELQGYWQLTDRQKLTASSFITPDVSDFNNYMILSRLEWSMKLDYMSGLSLVGGLRDQYQSPSKANGAHLNDLRIYLGFKLDI